MAFEEWWNEIEGYSTRGERFLHDWAEDFSPMPWAIALWQEAYASGYQKGYSEGFDDSQNVYDKGYMDGVRMGFSMKSYPLGKEEE